MQPPDGVAELTVRGTVIDGVEAGCRLLGEYLLVATASAGRDLLYAGARVEVTGWVDHEHMSFCQQGIPLRVTSVRPL